MRYPSFFISYDLLSVWEGLEIKIPEAEVAKVIVSAPPLLHGPSRCVWMRLYGKVVPLAELAVKSRLPEDRQGPGVKIPPHLLMEADRVIE